MRVIKSFELEAIRLMAGGVLSIDQIRGVEDIQSLDSYEYTGSGYFLTVTHPLLPAEEITLSEPLIVGKAGEIQAGFVVFVGKGQLTFECHTWGAVDVPADFREQVVVISTPPANYIDLRDAT
jgi:hypothetical protein